MKGYFAQYIFLKNFKHLFFLSVLFPLLLFCLNVSWLFFQPLNAQDYRQVEIFTAPKVSFFSFLEELYIDQIVFTKENLEVINSYLILFKFIICDKMDSVSNSTNSIFDIQKEFLPYKMTEISQKKNQQYCQFLNDLNLYPFTQNFKKSKQTKMKIAHMEFSKLTELSQMNFIFYFFTHAVKMIHGPFSSIFFYKDLTQAHSRNKNQKDLSTDTEEKKYPLYEYTKIKNFDLFQWYVPNLFLRKLYKDLNSDFIKKFTDFLKPQNVNKNKTLWIDLRNNSGGEQRFLHAWASIFIHFLSSQNLSKQTLTKVEKRDFFQKDEENNPWRYQPSEGSTLSTLQKILSTDEIRNFFIPYFEDVSKKIPWNQLWDNYSNDLEQNQNYAKIASSIIFQVDKTTKSCAELLPLILKTIFPHQVTIIGEPSYGKLNSNRELEASSFIRELKQYWKQKNFFSNLTTAQQELIFEQLENISTNLHLKDQISVYLGYQSIQTPMTKKESFHNRLVLLRPIHPDIFLYSGTQSPSFEMTTHENSFVQTRESYQQTLTMINPVLDFDVDENWISLKFPKTQLLTLNEANSLNHLDIHLIKKGIQKFNPHDSRPKSMKQRQNEFLSQHNYFINLFSKSEYSFLTQLH